MRGYDSAAHGTAVSLTPLRTKIGDFIVDFLREFEAIFKCVSEAYQSCLMKKPRGRKSRVRVPLSYTPKCQLQIYTPEPANHLNIINRPRAARQHEKFR
jgi:hypothetical protein